MIRRIARLALDALIVEAKHWLAPSPPGAPELAPVATTPAGRTYPRCIICAADLGGPKVVAESVCATCVRARDRRSRPRKARVKRGTVPQSTESTIVSKGSERSEG